MVKKILKILDIYILAQNERGCFKRALFNLKYEWVFVVHVMLCFEACRTCLISRECERYILLMEVCTAN